MLRKGDKNSMKENIHRLKRRAAALMAVLFTASSILGILPGAVETYAEESTVTYTITATGTKNGEAIKDSHGADASYEFADASTLQTPQYFNLTGVLEGLEAITKDSTPTLTDIQVSENASSLLTVTDATPYTVEPASVTNGYTFTTANISFKIGTDEYVLQFNREADIYKIKFDYNGGSYFDEETGTVKSYGERECASGESIQIPGVDTADKYGFSFANKWNTEADGSGTDYNVGADYTPTGDTTLYAQWTAEEYTVSFNMNGKSASPIASQQIAYGEKATKPDDPTASGFKFLGWKTDTDQDWDFSQDIVTRDTVLYANWCDASKTTHTVTFDRKGHGTAPDDKIVISGEKISGVGCGTDEVYSFVGWYKETDCTNKWDFASDTVTSDITLYAKWVEVSNKLNIDDTYPANAGKPYGDTEPIELRAEATLTDGAEAQGYGIAYQWCTYDENGEEEEIEGAKSASYSISGLDAGIYTYFGAISLTYSGESVSTGQSREATVTIAKKDVTISGSITAKDKGYDGTVDATFDVSQANITGLLDGDKDKATIAVSGQFNDANSGTNKPVTVTEISLTGEKGGNYNVTSPVPTGLTANITAVDISNDPRLVITLDKSEYVYTGSDITPGVSVKFGDTTFSDSEFNVTYENNKNVGTATLKVTSTDALVNCSFANVAKEFPIVAKPVTVAGISAASKTYDGSTDATLIYSGVTFTGKASGDELAVTATGKFEDANAGTGKRVNILNLALSGADAANYRLADTGQQTQTTGTITPKAVTASIAMYSDTYTYTGEEITPRYRVSATSGTFSAFMAESDYTAALANNKNAGDGEVTISSKTGGNYTFSSVTETFPIGRADATVTCDNKVKAQDAGSDPALTATVTGLKGSDQESVLTYTIRRQAGSAIGEYPIKATGEAVQGNYNVSYVDGVFRIVDKSALTLTVSQASVTYGTPLPAPTYNKPAEEGTETLTYSGTIRKDGSAYGHASKAPTEAGEYTVEVTYETESGVYQGTSNKFYINPVNISSAVIETGTDLTYNGADQTMEVKSVKIGDKDIKDICTIEGNTAKSAGNHTITAKVDEHSNYTGTASKVFTIAKAIINVTADPASKAYGAADPEFTYTASGFVGNDKQSSILTGKLSRESGEGAGTYDITKGTDDYRISFKSANFTISKGHHDNVVVPNKIKVSPEGTAKASINLAAYLPDEATLAGYTTDGALGSHITVESLTAGRLIYSMTSCEEGLEGSIILTIASRDFDDYKLTLMLYSGAGGGGGTTEVVIEDTGVPTEVSSVAAPGLEDYTRSLSQDNVDVKMEVKPVSENTLPSSTKTNVSDAINKYYYGLRDMSHVKTEYLNIDITKSIGDALPEAVHDLGRVIEIEVGYPHTAKYNLCLTREHNGAVTTLRKLTVRPTSNFVDGTFYANGSDKVYIYSRYYSLYTVSYTDILTFRVTFDDACGNITTYTVPSGDKVTKPADPSRSGYKFLGWYAADGSLYNFDLGATSDMTLTAKWTPSGSSSSSSSTSSSTSSSSSSARRSSSSSSKKSSSSSAKKSSSSSSKKSSSSSKSGSSSTKASYKTINKFGGSGSSGGSSDTTNNGGGKVSNAPGTGDDLPSIMLWSIVISIVFGFGVISFLQYVKVCKEEKEENAKRDGNGNNE